MKTKVELSSEDIQRIIAAKYGVEKSNVTISVRFEMRGYGMGEKQYPYPVAEVILEDLEDVPYSGCGSAYCIHTKYGSCPVKSCNLNSCNAGDLEEDRRYIDAECSNYMDD